MRALRLKALALVIAAVCELPGGRAGAADKPAARPAAVRARLVLVPPYGTPPTLTALASELSHATVTALRQQSIDSRAGDAKAGTADADAVLRGKLEVIEGDRVRLEATYRGTSGQATGDLERLDELVDKLVMQLRPALTAGEAPKPDKPAASEKPAAAAPEKNDKNDKPGKPAGGDKLAVADKPAKPPPGEKPGKPGKPGPHGPAAGTKEPPRVVVAAKPNKADDDGDKPQPVSSPPVASDTPVAPPPQAAKEHKEPEPDTSVPLPPPEETREGREAKEAPPRPPPQPAVEEPVRVAVNVVGEPVGGALGALRGVGGPAQHAIIGFLKRRLHVVAVPIQAVGLINGLEAVARSSPARAHFTLMARFESLAVVPSGVPAGAPATPPTGAAGMLALTGRIHVVLLHDGQDAFDRSFALPATYFAPADPPASIVNRATVSAMESIYGELAGKLSH